MKSKLDLIFNIREIEYIQKIDNQTRLLYTSFIRHFHKILSPKPYVKVKGTSDLNHAKKHQILHQKRRKEPERKNPGAVEKISFIKALLYNILSVYIGVLVLLIVYWVRLQETV